MSFWNKEVFGIKYLYLALLAVGAIAFIAWRIKPVSGNPSEPTATTDEDAASEVGGDLGADYGYLDSNGTVTVQQTGQPTIVTPVTVATNEKWARDGAAWIASRGLATQDRAFMVLNKYLEGEPLSFDEGKLRDAWVSQSGLPPESFQSGGTLPAPVTPKPPTVTKPVLPPSGFRNKVVERTSATVAWSPVAGAAGYEILYPTGKTNRTTSASASFYGIKPNTRFTYRVRAYNAAGVGPWSAPQYFLTHR